MAAPLIAAFQSARRDPEQVVLEGFHAVKHALRFGAEPTHLVAAASADLSALAAQLAPDLAGRIAAAERVDDALLAQLAPRPPRTGLLALAPRPLVDPAAVLAGAAAGLGPGPIVLLESPRTMGNLGAVIRVAAAAGAGAVLTTGPHDPWHPDAVRGAAGLHFALPVARLPHDGAADASPAWTTLPADLPLLALDPDGTDLEPARLPTRAILAFGTERDGLTDELLARATARVRLPMQDGVSSLNLATSVAATLYAWRLAGR